MNNLSFLRGITLKIFAIIGFSATILVIGWLLLMLVTNGQSFFATLAEKVRNMDLYQKTEEVPEEEKESEVEITNETKEETQVQIQPTHSTPTASIVTDSYTDLRVSILGTGVMNNGIFAFTSHYESQKINAVMVDIANIGTTLSLPWSFVTSLPNGVVYTSPLQIPLRPQEHAVFTLQYSLDHSKHPRIMSTVLSSKEISILNNTASWNVERM